MKQADAERLLGGHATGTLTEAERAELFAAALDRQEVFEALLDEEALRELLTDPAARAALLAALAPPGRVVPFWRRSGVLGAAAGLLVAATAALAVLRSPEDRPAPVAEAARPALLGEAPGAGPAPAAAPEAQRTTARAKVAPPAPPAETTRALGQPPVARLGSAGIAPAAAQVAPPLPAQEAVSAEARDDLARKQVAASPVSTALAERAEAPAPAARAALKKTEAPGPAGGLAGAANGVMADQTATFPAPTWRLTPQPDGQVQITVTATRRAHAVLLKRGAQGVQVIALGAGAETQDATRTWVALVRLASDEALDLYVLPVAPAQPAALPATGPVAGFRARVWPGASGPEKPR